MDPGELQLEPLSHRGNYCIAVRGRLNSDADKAIRNFPHRQFSKTHSCWYVPYTADALTSLIQKLSVCQPVVVVGVFTGAEPAVRNNLPTLKIPLPEGYHETLILRRYSESTIRTYESQFRAFLSYLHPKTIDDISDEVIRAYEFYLVNTKKVSLSTQNTAINAIKFYLEHVLRGERKVYYIDRPNPAQKLPRVLSEEEVVKLIEVTRNVKHRCILMVLYSSGIRMSELLNLRWSAFDEERMQLFVDGGKGQKDRFTLLSEATVEYTKFYKNLYQPSDFLFEGPGKRPYSPRSVNNIIHRSAVRAGIIKKVSAHTLRHHRLRPDLVGTPRGRQFCDSFVGTRGRFALYSGINGAREQQDDGTVYARDYEGLFADKKSSGPSEGRLWAPEQSRNKVISATKWPI